MDNQISKKEEQNSKQNYENDYKKLINLMELNISNELLTNIEIAYSLDTPPKNSVEIIISSNGANDVRTQ